jgi:hypothetical protein
MTYFTRGHVDFDAFKAEFEKAHDEKFGNGWSEPTHEIWRCVPDNTGEFKYLYVPTEKVGKGAFKVTVTTCEH